MPGVPEDDRLEDHVTPADLAAVVADWCEAHGVGRVDLAIALLGAEVANTGGDYALGEGLHAWATIGDGARHLTPNTQRIECQRRAAALAVAAMRCDLEGR